MRNLILLALILTALYSCEQDNRDQVPEEETGILTIKMATKDIPPEVAQVKGELSRPDEESIFFDFEIDNTNALARVEGIPVGNWAVRVDAYSSEGEVIYSGSASVEIAVGKTTTVHLTLTATGSLEIVVVWGGDAQLVAHYPFYGNGHDHSGKGHHGEVLGASLTCDRFGHPDRAYYFDGIDDVIALDPFIYNGNVISIAAWIKKLGDGSDPWNSVVAGDCSVPYFGFKGDAPTFGGQCETPMDHQFTDFFLSDTAWHHMVGIYDGSSILLYFDNNLLINEFVGSCKYDNSIPIGIGGSYKHFRDLECFHGIIDDVRIYDGVLTVGEIERLFHEDENTISHEGLIAYYPFSGNANDESGHGNNGTVKGAILTSDRFGNSNSAYYFDGIDDFIRIKHTSDFDFSGSKQISFGAWVNFEGPDEGSIIGATTSRSHFAYAIAIYPDYSFGGSLHAFGGWFDSRISEVIDLYEWNHLFFTADDNSIKNYLNGIMIKEDNLSNVLWKNSSAYDSYIGVWEGDYGFQTFFKGKIDDIAIYNRLLSDDEVKDLYHSGGWD